jgi:muramidase (phage lysozyme)
MANDAAKDQLDSILSIIGFGIVSDFRELREAMFGLTSEMQQSNLLIDQVNRNTSSTEKTLDDFQKELARQRDARAFRQLENQLERRNKLNSDRSEASLRQIAQAMEKIQREIMFGNLNRGDESGGLLDDAPTVIPGAGGGSFLRGAAKVAVGTAVVGGLAIAGATAAYSMGAFDQGESTAPDTGSQTVPTASAASVTSTPPITSDLSRAGAGTGAALQQTSAMAQSLKLVPDTARQKAVAKVAPRVPSWLSKFGGRLTQTIGLQSIPVFGTMVGGYFAFNKFMSGDSWYALGAEYVAGKAPQIDVYAGPDEWTAGVISTLAIQTYLIAREIYQEENAIDIRNGIVPNFDDLEASEKIQVLKAVKVYVEGYVNNLISRGRQTADAVTGITPTVTSGAAPGAAAVTGTGGASLAGAAAAATAAGAGGPPPADTSDGTMQSVGPDTDQQTQQAPAPSPSGGLTPSAPSALGGGGNAGAGASGGTNTEDQDSEPNASPSDTIASISTGSDQTSMYSGGEYGTILDYLADSEGADYNTQYGYQNTTDGRLLTEMTVAEVMEAQRKQEGSSAIGRYQFMRQTMIDGLNAGVITQDEVFSPATQDRFATWLIENKRKGSKWRAGKMSNEDFGRALSQEWASVPDPYTGASYYGQRIKYDVETLMNVIESAKGPPKPMAEGGKVTPLTSDKPKAGRDMSMELRPPPAREEESIDEDKITSSQSTIDARRRDDLGGSPKEKTRNTISSYMPAMTYLFGTMTEELSAHLNGEVSADKAFRDAMNPLS